MRAPSFIDHLDLYRLPWNLADNPIAWLEPTDHCNLHCDGCYRQNGTNHKSLEEIDANLDVFARLRRFDGVSIAGGDPLTHPDIVEIVRRIRHRGSRPIVNTNGHALTPELLRELKKAGIVGFTFHVDSKQGRPDWRGKDEIGMNELRSRYAEMVAEAGGISCAFNSTVYPDTLEQVPDILAWAQRNIDIVQTVVFIIFRHADMSGGAYDYYAAGERVEIDQLTYAERVKRNLDVTANDLVSTIRERFPDYSPCAYLNGTHKPDSFKWLLALRLGDKRRAYGYAGPKLMELVQSGYHFLTGHYLGYATPDVHAMGRSMAVAGALIDGGMRHALLNLAQRAVARPQDLLRPVYLQGVMIIQPIDILDNGDQNMCDGCPDMTVHNGRLVWSCRLEELRKYDTFLQTVPNHRQQHPSER